MDKKLALITLVEHSFILSEEDKLAILAKIETLTDEEVEKFGSFLSAEHDFVIHNKDEIKENIMEVIKEMEAYTPQPTEQVYVGTGRAG